MSAMLGRGHKNDQICSNLLTGNGLSGYIFKTRAGEKMCKDCFLRTDNSTAQSFAWVIFSKFCGKQMEYDNF